MTLRTFTLKDFPRGRDEAERTLRLDRQRPFASSDLHAAGLEFIPLPDPAAGPPGRRDDHRLVRREREDTADELALARDWARRHRP